MRKFLRVASLVILALACATLGFAGGLGLDWFACGVSATAALVLYLG